MAYTKQTWADLPTKTSPFTAARMNHIEDGISDNDTNKLDKSSVKSAKTTSASDVYSCNYVNSIIESGSNSNGSWIKFEDGTMICRIKKEYSVVFKNSQKWGLLWESNLCSLENFPTTFKAVPSVIVMINSSSGGLIEYVINTTTSFAGYVQIFRPVETDGTLSYTMSVVAIGKWK